MWTVNIQIDATFTGQLTVSRDGQPVIDEPLWLMHLVWPRPRPETAQARDEEEVVGH
jgi:hypothetical protein